MRCCFSRQGGLQPLVLAAGSLPLHFIAHCLCCIRQRRQRPTWLSVFKSNYSVISASNLAALALPSPNTCQHHSHQGHLFRCTPCRSAVSSSLWYHPTMKTKGLMTVKKNEMVSAFPVTTWSLIWQLKHSPARTHACVSVQTVDVMSSPAQGVCYWKFLV